MSVTQQQIDQMRKRITDEIFFALGLGRSGIFRQVLGWLFYLPTDRFARIFAAADEATSKEGLYGGARSIVRDLSIRLRVKGAEAIPPDGPLMVVSNHPGAYDSVAIAASVPRHDLKILVAETSFYRTLPFISQHMIFARDDPTSRMLSVRQAIRHLQNGGALLQFGSGKIDADPAVEGTAVEDLANWSPSLNIMLRKAAETRVVIAIASGVLLRRFAEHPFTRLRRQPMARRRLAEFMQVIQQLLKPEAVHAQACLSFAPPVSVAELSEEAGPEPLLKVLLERARRLLEEHVADCG